jgi:heme-degrading monooxygenase HmoA
VKYGSVARMRLKPGAEDQMRQLTDADAGKIPGFAFSHVYRLDSGSNEYYLVVAFESREAYKANADNPEQHQRYLKYRELMEADPEWHDGEIVSSYPS